MKPILKLVRRIECNQLKQQFLYTNQYTIWYLRLEISTLDDCSWESEYLKILKIKSAIIFKKLFANLSEDYEDYLHWVKYDGFFEEASGNSLARASETAMLASEVYWLLSHSQWIGSKLNRKRKEISQEAEKIQGSAIGLNPLACGNLKVRPTKRMSKSWYALLCYPLAGDQMMS